MMDKRTLASWIPIPTSAPRPAKTKPESSQATLNLRKYPKPMREKVIKAIENMERWLKFDGRDVGWKTSLDDFRANRSCGITNPSFAMKFQGNPQVLEALYRLNEAFEEMHSYHPEDYLTFGMVSAVARYNKTGKVNEESAKAEKLLVGLKYHQAPRGNEKTHGTQGWIRKSVANSTSLSLRTVESIAAKLKKNMKADEIAK